MALINNIGQLQALAAEIQKYLFMRFLDDSLHDRLHIDVLARKPTITLKNVKASDKMTFAGNVVFGEKPKANLAFMSSL